MIVFDLRCGAGHVFEAWFGSSAAFAAQSEAGQVRCPVCDDTAVVKAAMAPAVGVKGNRAVPGSRTDAGAGPDRVPPQLVKDAMKALAAVQAKALESSQWVGGAFADRARAMHLGEERTVAIHGQASVAEARALIDEGVTIAPLPLPVVPPEQKN